MFADRVDLPFASVSGIEDAKFNATGFGTRLWSTRWYSWVVMSDLAVKPDWLERLGGLKLLGADATPWAKDLEDDIAELKRMAIEERADALAEIVSEADEFISKFLHLLSATPATHPATTRMLTVADALTALIAMHYKAHFNRARPTQIIPGLLSPILHTGHASYPSGHSTQAHAFVTLLTKVIPSSLGATMATPLKVLADRIARNREIAGLHYPSDTAAGVTLAEAITTKILLDQDYLPKFTALVVAATKEWENPGVFA